MAFYVAIAALGAGMFMLGWFSHGWVLRARAIEAAEPATTTWRCGQCGREKVLPADLDAKVLVCNNCQVRLHRAGE